MGWHLDPELLELFESVHAKLSAALEARRRLSDRLASVAANPILAVKYCEEIAGLELATAALARAMDLRHPIVLH
jgi:hypothetical protein